MNFKGNFQTFLLTAFLSLNFFTFGVSQVSPAPSLSSAATNCLLIRNCHYHRQTQDSESCFLTSDEGDVQTQPPLSVSSHFPSRPPSTSSFRLDLQALPMTASEACLSPCAQSKKKHHRILLPMSPTGRSCGLFCH